MPTININNANASTNVQAGYDAFLGAGAVNDTIGLNGTDTLHGGLDANSNTINASGDNTINVIIATINDTSGTDTINGRGAFNDISANGAVFVGAVALVDVSNSGTLINAPSGYDVLLTSGVSNDTIDLNGGNILHGGFDANSNTINVAGNNVINVMGITTINSAGGNDTITGKNLYTNEITLTGPGNNTVYGGNGSIVFDNGSGNNLIYAQALVNEHKIYMGSGNDTLVVRDGVGGANVPGNLDTVTVFNFVPGHDVLALNTAVGDNQINAGNIANIMSNAFGYHNLYTELVLGGMSIIFQGVKYSDLHASDFVLV